MKHTPGERQQQSHADVVEQRASDGDGDREAEKRQAENARDHLGRMDLVDRIEEDALQVAGGIRPQRRADTRHRQRQAADEEQPGPGILCACERTGRAAHSTSGNDQER